MARLTIITIALQLRGSDSEPIEPLFQLYVNLLWRLIEYPMRCVEVDSRAVGAMFRHRSLRERGWTGRVMKSSTKEDRLLEDMFVLWNVFFAN